MALILLAIVASGAVGVQAQRQIGSPATRLSTAVLTAMLYLVTPIVTFANLARLRVDASLGLELVCAWVALLGAGAIAWMLARRGLGMTIPTCGTVSGAAMQANTGYLGLPICSALLGADGLQDAVAYNSLVQGPVFLLAVFAVAAAAGTKAGANPRERLRAFFVRNPPLLAAVAGLLAPAALAPDWLIQVTQVLVYALPVLGFFAVGIALAAQAEERGGGFIPPITRDVAATVAVRLALAPALLAVLSLAVHVPEAWLISSAMPLGLNAITVAYVYGLDLPLAASSIAWSTVIGLAAVVAVSLVA